MIIAYLLTAILTVPIAWFLGLEIAGKVTPNFRKLLPFSFLLFLNGLIEGLVAFGVVKLIFGLLNTPFSYIPLIIVGIEFGIIYANGILMRTILSEIPMAIGTLIGLFILLIF